MRPQEERLQVVEMGPQALFPQGLPSSLPSALLPRPPQKVLDAVCGGTAVSGRGNTHMTQSWPIRASHFPGHRGWFRDGRVTQVRPIRILPGFCQISWERWSDQGGVISSGRDRPASQRDPRLCISNPWHLGVSVSQINKCLHQRVPAEPLQRMVLS